SPPRPTLLPSTTLFRSRPRCRTRCPRPPVASTRIQRVAGTRHERCLGGASPGTRSRPEVVRDPAGFVAVFLLSSGTCILSFCIRSEEHTSELQSRVDVV